MRAVATWPKKHRAVDPGPDHHVDAAPTHGRPPRDHRPAARQRPERRTATRRSNLGEPASLNACWSYGATDARCRTATVDAINLGRTREGLRTFTLPSNWTSLDARAAAARRSATTSARSAACARSRG